MESLYLLSQGLSRTQVESINRISKRTLVEYIAEYRQGLDVVRTTHYQGKSSELHRYADELKAYFTAHPPHSMKQAAAVIEERTGLKRSTQQVREFVRSLGFRPLRTGLLPAKADAQKQEDFKKKTWSLV
ncbi:MAG: winged helix-turn-helix domain-containing protein [Candidatus Kapabacteria bacterium]|jgi:transposase|nr:winged helix-turn-helix domain-containing protein [Candidatus Kapabacteria bacterium]